MKLQSAILCVDCEELIDAATHPRTCPKCGSRVLHLLALWLRPKSNDDSNLMKEK